MDRVVLDVVGDLAAVDGATRDVPDAAQDGGADGHHHGATGVLDREAATQAVGRGHGDRADDAMRELGLDLEDRLLGVVRGLDGEGGVDARHLAVELDVHDRADDTDDGARADAPVHLLVGGLLEGSARLFSSACH